MNVPRDLATAVAPAAAPEIPEVNGGDATTIKGPPDEKDKTMTNTLVVKPRFRQGGPMKNEGGKSIADKTGTLNAAPKGPNNSAAIWKTKPKT